MSPVRRCALLVSGLLAVFFIALMGAPGAVAATPSSSAQASTQSAPQVGEAAPTAASVLRAGPQDPKGPHGPRGKNSTDINVNLKGLADKPSSSVSTIIALTLVSLLPAILLTCTSFTKILVVLGLTRNALGLQQTPPNQVLTGLALFLSLFIMTPVLSSMNTEGLKPYMDGTKTSAQAWKDGSQPLKTFMLKNTEDAQLRLLTNVAKRDLPKDRKDVDMATLVPAFVLSELKQAFIIGFIVFIPFLVIDIVVAGALMALGMMMMPPVMVSLPFKLLLFVLVDGWGLLIKALVASYG